MNFTSLPRYYAVARNLDGQAITFIAFSVKAQSDKTSILRFIIFHFLSIFYAKVGCLHEENSVRDYFIFWANGA